MSAGESPSAAPEPPGDPLALIRTRQYRVLLVVAALIGIVVSLASWAFLELTHGLQQWVFTDLPSSLGYDPAPWWWPLPPLAVAGVTVALAVTRLPGHGGHEPSEGLATGAPTQPIELPGVLIAAIATISLGLVLGPEAPLLALGAGLALLLVGLARRPMPDQAKLVLAAAGTFAAIATIFGSPVIGAVIIIEAAGLGGATMPLILLPGLLAAGIGSLVFVGIGHATGLSTSAYALPALSLPAYPRPTPGALLWTVPLAVATAVVVFVVIELARRTKAVSARRPLLLVPATALLVGGIAIAFGEISGKSPNAILFSGQDEMTTVVHEASTLSLATLGLLLLCKSLAWSLSLGVGRGGPTFPAIFLGLVGGLLAAHLPGFAETPAVGVLVGAAVVSVLKLPLSAIVLALLLTQGGAGVAPLVVVGVVVAYICVQMLSAHRAARLERLASATA